VGHFELKAALNTIVTQEELKRTKTKFNACPPIFVQVQNLNETNAFKSNYVIHINCGGKFSATIF